MTGNSKRDPIEQAIPDRIWDLYFGPKGEIAQLKQTTQELHECLKELDRKLDRYNSLHDKFTEHAKVQKEIIKRLEAQEKKCEEELQSRQTETEVRNRIRQERKETEAKEHDKYIRTIKFAGVTISAVLVLINIVLFIVGNYILS